MLAGKLYGYLTTTAAAMPDNALVVLKLNFNPSGKQPVMRDGWWGGKPQQMYFNLGKIPKGM